MELCGEVRALDYQRDVLVFDRYKDRRGVPRRGRKYMCSVGTCHSSNMFNPGRVSHFSFPKERDRCKDWLQRIGRMDLLDTKDFNQMHRVCGLHFNEDDFMTKNRNRLKSSAAPHFQDRRLVDHDYAKLMFDLSIVTAPEQTPGSVEPIVVGQPHQSPNSKIFLSSGSQLHVTPECTTPSKVVKLKNSLASKTSSSKGLQLHVTPGCATLKVESELHQKEKEEKKTVQTENRKRNQRLYQKILRLKRQKASLTKKMDELRKSRAPATVEEIVTAASNYLSDTALSIFESQLRQGKRANVSRRWTENDKKFALDLYLTSYRAYMVVRKFLVLPSLATIQNWRKEEKKSKSTCDS